MDRVIAYFSHYPLRLLRVDMLGALATSLSIGIGLRYYSEAIGMQDETLLLLSGVATILFIWGAVGMLLKKWPIQWLSLLLVCNLAYCVFTIVHILSYQSPTALGCLYFAIEICIILVLSYLEYHVIRRHQSSATTSSQPT